MIGVCISFPVHLRGWRSRLALNGAAHISSVVRDIGFSKSSPKKSVVCCWTSWTRREGTVCNLTVDAAGTVPVAKPKPGDGQGLETEMGEAPAAHGHERDGRVALPAWPYLAFLEPWRVFASPPTVFVW